MDDLTLQINKFEKRKTLSLVGGIITVVLGAVCLGLSIFWFTKTFVDFAQIANEMSSITNPTDEMINLMSKETIQLISSSLCLSLSSLLITIGIVFIALAFVYYGAKVKKLRVNPDPNQNL